MSQTRITSDADMASLVLEQSPAGNTILRIDGPEEFAQIYLGPKAIAELLTELTALTDEQPTDELPMLWASTKNGVHTHE